MTDKSAPALNAIHRSSKDNKPRNEIKKAAAFVPAIARHLEDSPTLNNLHNNLNGARAQQLSYPSIGDVRTIADITEGINERIVHLKRAGNLKRLHLEYHWFPHLDRASSSLGIDLKEIAKGFNQIKKAAPDSISRIVVAAVPSTSEQSPFEMIVAVCTLALLLTDGSPFPRTPSSASGGARLEALGSRPELQAITVEDPSEEDVERLVQQFIKAPGQLRAVALQLAKEQKDESWRGARADHQLALFQIDAMLPAAKALSGAGQGEQILRIALTGPTARAQKIKKDSASLDRSDVVELFWSDALARRTAKPPYVKL